MTIPEPQRRIGMQTLPWKTPPALTAVLTPQQQIDQLRMAVAALDERHNDLVAALEADLEKAEEGVAVSRKNWLDAGTEDPHRTTHLRNIYQYNEGYRACISRVLELVKRGQA